jgi:hypothetical protein
MVLASPDGIWSDQGLVVPVQPGQNLEQQNLPEK